MTNDLRHEKRVLQNRIFDLIEQFEKDTGMEVKEIEIVRVQSYAGKFNLGGIKILTDL